MNDAKTYLTCKEASNLLGFTQRHILNLIKNGKLSADRDEGGKYYIQKSEFFRAFPHAMRIEQARTEEKSSGTESMKALEEKIKHLEEIVDEKKKQNEFLTEQLGNFTQEKFKMLDAINSHARLLEYKETGESNSSKTKWWSFSKK